jgi:predicted acyltransferase
MLVNISEHAGLIKLNLPVIGDASSVTLVMCGLVVSVLYGELSIKSKTGYLSLLFITAGAVFILGGFMIRPFAGGISKIHATPAWVFICSGISLLFFTLMIWLVDIKGKQQWFSIIAPAGTSTLTCYLIPYLLYSVYNLLHFQYPAFLNYGMGGLLRSMMVSVLIILLVGVMEKSKLRLKI